MKALAREVVNSVDYLKSHGIVDSNVPSAQVAAAQIKRIAAEAEMKVNLGAENFRKLESESKKLVDTRFNQLGRNVESYNASVQNEVIPQTAGTGHEWLVEDLAQIEAHTLQHASTFNSITTGPQLNSAIAPIHKPHHFPTMMAIYNNDYRLRPFKQKCPTFWDQYLRDSELPVNECGNYVEFDVSVDGKISCKEAGDDPTYLIAKESVDGGICMCHYSTLLALDSALVNCMTGDHFRRIVEKSLEMFWREGITMGAVFNAIKAGTVRHPTLQGPLSQALIKKAKAVNDCADDYCCDFDLAIFGKGESNHEDVFFQERGDGARPNPASSLTPYKDYGIKALDGDILLASAGFLIGAVGSAEYRNGPTIDFKESDRQIYRSRGGLEDCLNKMAIEWKGGFGLDLESCIMRISSCGVCEDE